MICVFRATRADVTVGSPKTNPPPHPFRQPNKNSMSNSCCNREAAAMPTKRLVVGIGVEGLRAAKDRRHGFNGCADNVVKWVLLRQGDAGGLAVGTQ